MARYEVGAVEYAVADAVASLTRLRIRQDGPFFLERPRTPLTFTVTYAGETRVSTEVRCETWGSTVLKLTLDQGGMHEDWLAWGDMEITYGRHPRPELSGKTIKRYLEPSFASSDKNLPMRYRVRTRVAR